MSDLGEPIMHDRCKDVAIRWSTDSRPRVGDLMDVTLLAHKDGKSVGPGDLMICDTCGDPIGLQPDFTGGTWRAIS